MGSLPFNTIRMTMSLLFLILTLWLIMGVPYPRYADGETWCWLLLSGLVGYVIGDYCLMQGYIHIGSRFGQLFMTLSAPTAAITGRIILGEHMRPVAILGMVVTLSGIALSILSKNDTTEHNGLRFKLPARGIFYAAMAGICQGFGLVLSKQGLQHYDAALTALHIPQDAVFEEALLPLPISICVPFAATTIRAYIGVTGFFLSLMLFSKKGMAKLRSAARDRKAMWCVFAATIFGPFIGVSASLLATMYTSAGIAQTIFALTPILIIAPSAILFHQKVTFLEVIGAVISVVGMCLFFI
jgi:drug/metabolite transporter (DMT)-like permease